MRNISHKYRYTVYGMYMVHRDKMVQLGKDNPDEKQQKHTISCTHTNTHIQTYHTHSEQTYQKILIRNKKKDVGTKSIRQQQPRRLQPAMVYVQHCKDCPIVNALY